MTAGYFGDDVTPLLGDPARAKPAEVGFHQGLIQTWDATTGENTVLVNGALVSDLPILNTGEAVALRAGHVVGLLRFQTTYFILGRITLPNDPQFASASVAFESAGAEGSGFGITTSISAQVGVNIPVPAWADEAIVMIVGFCNLSNSRAVADSAFFEVGAEGGSGGAASQTFAATGAQGSQHTMHASSRNLFDAAGFFGDGIINVQGRANSVGANWTAVASNYMVIHAIAIFRSVI